MSAERVVSSKNGSLLGRQGVDRFLQGGVEEKSNEQMRLDI